MREDKPEEAPYVVERIIERSNGNGGYNRLKDIVFVSLVLAAGAIIWNQQQAIESLKQAVAILNLKCEGKPLYRGGGGGNERP